MGANASRVRQQHRDISALAQDIQKNAAIIVQTAKDIGYDSRNPEICQRLTFTYKNRLNQFNRSTLIEVMYNIGFAPTAAQLQQVNKQQICDIIVEYYRRKIDLVEFVNNELEGSCRTTERQVAANMEQMLEGASPSVQRLAYQRLVSLNGALQMLFERANDAIRFISSEEVTPEILERYVQQAFEQLAQDKVNCCRRAHALRQFAYFPIGANNAGNIRFKNAYTDEVVDRLPRVTQIEPELPIALLPC